MEKRMRRIGGLAALGTMAFIAAFTPSSARADQPFPGRAERLLSPGRSVVSEDSAEALVLNPANLANLPARELRWTGVWCPDDTRRVACGRLASCSSMPKQTASRLSPEPAVTYASRSLPSRPAVAPPY